MLKKAMLYTFYVWLLTMVGITVWALLISDDIIDFTWNKFAITTITQFIVGIPIFYWLFYWLTKYRSKNKNEND